MSCLARARVQGGRHILHHTEHRTMSRPTCPTHATPRNNEQGLKIFVDYVEPFVTLLSVARPVSGWPRPDSEARLQSPAGAAVLHVGGKTGGAFSPPKHTGGE